MIHLSISPFFRTKSVLDFSSQNTPSVTSLLKLQMLSRGTRGTNCVKHLDEIHVDEIIEDDVREIHGDIVTEKVFGRCEGLSGMILMM